MKKLGLPDSADVNLPPPHPQFILLQSIIASSLERKKDRQKMPAKPFSPALLSCKALPLFWRTALTLQVLAQGTRWSATWACSRVSRAVVNRECDSGSIRACMGPSLGDLCWIRFGRLLSQQRSGHSLGWHPGTLPYRTLGSLPGLCASMAPTVTREGWQEGQGLGVTWTDKHCFGHLPWTPAAKVSLVCPQHCQLQATFHPAVPVLRDSARGRWGSHHLSPV